MFPVSPANITLFPVNVVVSRNQWCSLPKDISPIRILSISFLYNLFLFFGTVLKCFQYQHPFKIKEKSDIEKVHEQKKQL
jgi:hypothetical protein